MCASTAPRAINDACPRGREHWDRCYRHRACPLASSLYATDVGLDPPALTYLFSKRSNIHLTTGSGHHTFKPGKDSEIEE